MAHKIIWTPEADAAIRRMRAERLSWDAIGLALGVSRDSLVQRGKQLNAAAPDAPEAEALPIARVDRDTLPPGHPTSWGAISSGPWPGPLRNVV